MTSHLYLHLPGPSQHQLPVYHRNTPTWNPFHSCPSLQAIPYTGASGYFNMEVIITPLLWFETPNGFPSHSRSKPEFYNDLQDLVRLHFSDFLTHYSPPHSPGSSPLAFWTFPLTVPSTGSTQSLTFSRVF